MRATFNQYANSQGIDQKRTGEVLLTAIEGGEAEEFRDLLATLNLINEALMSVSLDLEVTPEDVKAVVLSKLVALQRSLDYAEQEIPEPDDEHINHLVSTARDDIGQIILWISVPDLPDFEVSDWDASSTTFHTTFYGKDVSAKVKCGNHDELVSEGRKVTPDNIQDFEVVECIDSVTGEFVEVTDYISRTLIRMYCQNVLDLQQIEATE
ncbi:hypothetical protein ACFL2V_09390 [Pseudomonadota bacterium]